MKPAQKAMHIQGMANGFMVIDPAPGSENGTTPFEAKNAHVFHDFDCMAGWLRKRFTEKGNS